MGTRGICGFFANGELKISYNHFDSYPSALGNDCLEHAKWMSRSKDDLRWNKEAVKRIRLVNEDQPVTNQDITDYDQYADLSVSTSSPKDWYCLLRRLQGKTKETLEAGIMLDAGRFPEDSVFCEWGYIINLDDEVFEIYRGFQKEPHTDGRFSHLRNFVNETYDGEVYYPIRLIEAIPFSKLPESLDHIPDD